MQGRLFLLDGCMAPVVSMQVLITFGLLQFVTHCLLHDVPYNWVSQGCKYKVPKGLVLGLALHLHMPAGLCSCRPADLYLQLSSGYTCMQAA